MILKEQLKVLDKNELIYISSKSAYFFIGTIDEFFECSKKLDDVWQDRFEKVYNSQKRKLELLQERKPKQGKEVQKKVYDCESGKSRMEKVSYESQIKFWTEEVENQTIVLNEAYKRFTTYEPFLNRKVIEVYRNIANDSNIIRVTGYESGGFWLLSEALKIKHNKNWYDKSVGRDVPM